MEVFNVHEENKVPFGLRLVGTEDASSIPQTRKGFFTYEPNGEGLRLSGQETEILVLLKKGGTVSEETFMNFLHDDEDRDMPLTNGLAVMMTRLRKKLKKATNGELEIKTIRGLGYQLVKVNKDAYEKE